MEKEEEEEENGAAEDKIAENEEQIKYRGWKVMPYVIGNEAFNKMGDMGASANIVVYLTTVFNMSSASAAVIVSVLSGTTNMATILGAFLADAYLGRFSTIGFASIATSLGMAAMALTAAIPALHPHSCSGADAAGGRPSCQEPSPGQLAFLILGLGLMGAGISGIRPCNMAFGADQFDPKTEAGKRSINSFFNWYYFTYNISLVIALTAIVYVQSNVSWAVGFAIPAGLMLLSSALFFLGSPVYVKVRPEGSPFTGIVRVFVAAFRKRRLRLPKGGASATLFFSPPADVGLNTRLPQTNQFRFLERAAIIISTDGIEPNGSATNPWRLCSLQQVEEVKCLLRVIPIWTTSIIFDIILFILYTYATLQALQSNRRLGSTNFLIPAASMTVFNLLALTVWIPIYDRIIVPWLRRLTGKEGGITMLQRIGVGFVLSVPAVVVAAMVEQWRKRLALRHPSAGSVAENGGAISSMSCLWLIPQLAVYGVAEAFAMIGQMEFYYKEFPENMRSVAGSFFFCGLAVGGYVTGFLVTVVNRTTGRGGEGNSWLAEDLNQGELDHFYFLIAGMGLLNFVYFLVCARWYEYKRSCVAQEVALESCHSNSSLL